MDDKRKQEISDYVDEHAQSFTEDDRREIKKFMIENDELMKELAEM